MAASLALAWSAACLDAAVGADGAAAPASPDFCVSDTLGYVTALAALCPAGTTAIRGVGVNIFDVFWGAWGTGGPNATLNTSLQAVRDAGASGFRFARAFAAPWAYAGWSWLDPARRDAYWAAAAAVIAEAERADLKLVLSLGHGCPDSDEGCNPAVALHNETYREFITNASSLTRGSLRAYHADFVSRFKDSPAVLMWELGNEMNLAWDGCTYDKSDGAYFTTAEGLAYLAAAAADIKAIDPVRPVNTGMGSPRGSAKHLMELPHGVGGRACVTPRNPHGDCELCWDVVAPDTQQDSADMVALYYGDGGPGGDGGGGGGRGGGGGFDVVSSHQYGCAPPYGNYSWCGGDPGSTLPLQVFKAVADKLGKPFYVRC
jgi:hypothetical protein